MDVSVNLNLSPAEREWLQDLSNQIHVRLNDMNAQLEALIAQVQQTNEVMASAVTLINGLQGQLSEVQAELASQGVTNAKLDELTAALNQGDDALQALLNPPAPVVADPAPVDPVASAGDPDPAADQASS